MDLNVPPNPLSQIPSDAPLTKQHRHREYFILAIAVIVVAAGILWWQINQLGDISQAPAPMPTITPHPDVKDISDINKDIEGADTGDLDSDFQEVDNNLNKL